MKIPNILTRMNDWLLHRKAGNFEYGKELKMETGNYTCAWCGGHRCFIKRDRRYCTKCKK